MLTEVRQGALARVLPSLDKAVLLDLTFTHWGRPTPLSLSLLLHTCPDTLSNQSVSRLAMVLHRATHGEVAVGAATVSWSNWVTALYLRQKATERDTFTFVNDEYGGI